MSSEVTWLPNLVDGVVIWQLAGDLNQAHLLGGRLLVPDVEGPRAMPTMVTWHAADYMTLEEARARHPVEVRAAEEELERRLGLLEAELATPGSAFARFRAAFAMPPKDEPDSWFYDPNEHAIRVANWGATRRKEGAKSLAVHTTARFAKIASKKDESAAPGSATTIARAGQSALLARARGRGVALAALVVSVSLGLGLCALRRREPPPKPPGVPSVSASAVLVAPPDRDHDGTDDANDECPDLPGTRRGCPEAGAGIVVTRDRISTDELVFFATGSAKLDPKAREVLERIAKLLVDTPTIAEVLVEGHADAVGDDARNLALSAARAKSARDVLVSHGVAETRVRVAAHGAHERRVPVAGASPENRRVEIHITKVGL